MSMGRVVIDARVPALDEQDTVTWGGTLNRPGGKVTAWVKFACELVTVSLPAASLAPLSPLVTTHRGVMIAEREMAVGFAAFVTDTIRAFPVTPGCQDV